MVDWNAMSPARQKAATYAAHVENYMDIRGQTSITMTEATTAIWGTSGTGNPNAVRIIEACAQAGYLVITPHGKRARYISVKAGSIPKEAMSKKDRDYYKQVYLDDMKSEMEYKTRQMKKNIDEATTDADKSKAFLNGVADMLTPRRRR